MTEQQWQDITVWNALEANMPERITLGTDRVGFVCTVTYDGCETSGFGDTLEEAVARALVWAGIDGEPYQAPKQDGER